MIALHEGLIHHHGESPFDDTWFDRPNHDHRITTRIHIADYMWARTGALLAHATQVDPNERFWFGLNEEQLAATYPWEDWILARSHVGDIPDADGEHDLFDGISIGVDA